jgi:hypothetical protein
MAELRPIDPQFGPIDSLMAELGHATNHAGRREYLEAKNEIVRYRKTYMRKILKVDTLPLDPTSPIIGRLADNFLNLKGEEHFPKFWTADDEEKATWVCQIHTGSTPLTFLV